MFDFLKPKKASVKHTVTLKHRNGEQVSITIEGESQFQPGMTWENHGFGDDKWHFDHIIPCDAFDLTLEENQIKCFHYTNFQPLWQKDNLSKGSRYDSARLPN